MAQAGDNLPSISRSGSKEMSPTGTPGQSLGTRRRLGDRVGVEAGLESLSDEPLELEGGLRDEGDVGLDGLVNSTRGMRSKRSSAREAERGFSKNCSEGRRVPVGRTELARERPGHREELVGVVLEGGEVSSPGGQGQGCSSDGGGMKRSSDTSQPDRAPVLEGVEVGEGEGLGRNMQQGGDDEGLAAKHVGSRGQSWATYDRVGKANLL